MAMTSTVCFMFTNLIRANKNAESFFFYDFTLCHKMFLEVKMKIYLLAIKKLAGRLRKVKLFQEITLHSISKI